VTRVANDSPEIIRSRAIKRRNALTALVTGGLLAAYGARVYGLGQPRGLGILYGILAGLLYANLFEYALHRYPLHWGSGFLAGRHALHHDSEGTPEEARYVNFATSPWVVVLLFVANALPVFVVERLLHLGLAPGMLAAFTAYYILYEEIHWRMHLGGWLPSWLQAARHHHMLHHGGFEGRYNVFLPLCDWIFQRRHWKSSAPH
jgi:dihydroceramide fatty acyl 2-hydroxylase